jgi:DNA polymerase-3 subunit epsilon
MIGWFRRTLDRLVLRDRSYRFLFEPDKTGEVVSLDCETTGFDPWVDDVISVAAIKIRGNRILLHESFEAVVKPEAKVRIEAIKVHGLRKRDLEQGRPIAEVLPELLHFIGSRPLVGYWIDFDCDMLNKYMLQFFNIRLPQQRIDVSRLYYDRKYSKAPQGTEIDLRFDAIRTDLKLPPINQHDAFEDALLAAEMYVILQDMAERGIRIPRRAA